MKTSISPERNAYSPETLGKSMTRTYEEVVGYDSLPILLFLRKLYIPGYSSEEATILESAVTWSRDNLDVFMYLGFGVEADVTALPVGVQANRESLYFLFLFEEELDGMTDDDKKVYVAFDPQTPEWREDIKAQTDWPYRQIEGRIDEFLNLGLVQFRKELKKGKPGYSHTSNRLMALSRAFGSDWKVGREIASDLLTAHLFYIYMGILTRRIEVVQILNERPGLLKEP